MTITDLIYTALNELRDALPYLREALVPGTTRRWAQRDLTPEQQARQDALAIVEREDKIVNLAQGVRALGDGRAPLQIDVLDTAMDIGTATMELEAAVCDRLDLTPLAGATTAGRITRLIRLLDRIALHDTLAEHVHDEAVRLARRAARAIGDTEDVRRLNARCLVCDGKSLRAFMDREVVVCVNESCRCTDEECGCHSDQPRRHCWSFSQWPWLASALAGKTEVAS
ncbi:hypothetical protein GCM10010156_52580 [Planobispora rosea]|uniref:Uncharacterized protein n=1 Tax=Planobispora rosea TaxID=35762 RepID=A0A8J3WER4_PLARO|nr:hypothetical protein [Planobispora rosea]GGS87567.1 hypothetical protein GCM10010156_52580 [Planobispora rosea]GIH86660.1 hypothetical protein Pro02_50680 [Planobispora rosea]